MYAQNLTQGFYSPPAPDIFLWNGPGYPIVISPLAALGSSRFYYLLLNAALRYLSIILLFKTLRCFVPFRMALLFSCFWGLYFEGIVLMHVVFSETFAAFLVTLLMYAVTKLYLDFSIKRVVASGIILGSLILTKVIFAYAVLAGLVFVCIGMFFARPRSELAKAAAVMVVALAVTAPYLFYTWQLTGRFFYWSNAAGQQLYWMTSPYPGEYGDWQYPSLYMDGEPKPGKNCVESIVRANHASDIAMVYSGQNKKYYTGVEQDAAFKKLAVRNIRAHPFKYARNIFYNASRLLFSLPFIFPPERWMTVLRIVFNAMLLPFMLLCVFPTVINWRKLPFALRCLVSLSGIYLAGSLLVCAYPRMLLIVVPVVLLWVAVIMNNALWFKPRFFGPAALPEPK
ncbi:MAG: hypothetical protein A2234_02325 [Elusimicrobia bacterium RIFOXYA2_FULL_58_8]|nr:MAG: hypothetical protein A2285_02290 [Elusimicrobia bacterium RIFOXYA12_FULL_57_11]OGS13149.1 MAG: hypothetical protein A2234_02325 [Elusimicrobia bacterium RIFOXYA2_FULL_58_8]